MSKRKPRVRQAEIVRRFAVRLRELRESRNITMAQLSADANVALSHLGRLERGEASPGLDLMERLAKSLGMPLVELLPPDETVEPVALLREQAQKYLEKADRETLRIVNPLLARLS